MLRRTFSATAIGALILGPSVAAQPMPSPTALPDEDARLTRFFEDADLQRARLRPETLTLRGVKERYDELGDYTEASAKAALQVAEAQLLRMKRDFKRSRLSQSGQTSYDLFAELVARQRVQFKWYWQSYAVTSNGTALDKVPLMLITQHRVDSLDDAKAYVSRVAAVERVAGQVSDEIEQRTARGLISPALVFPRVIPAAENQIRGAPFDTGPDHPIWADLKKKVSALAVEPGLKERVTEDGRAALLGPWRRGYIRYLAALQAMSAKARGDDGTWALPQGTAYYAEILKFHTTTTLTPDEVHEIGLTEVARIRREMEVVKERIGFQGSLETFFAEIKTSPTFRYPNTVVGRHDCLAAANARIEDYMAVATQQFSTLPVQKLEIRAVEPFRERTAPAVPAYQPGGLDGSRPGILYFNLSDMTQVLKPQLPTFTYHEGVPGHHFQISRQHGATDLPTFRRLLTLTAYTEGWALYAERLAAEAGMYRDDYEEFGRLSLEAWRAARLVLDTGIHAKQWSRAQAVAYMQGNTLNSERDIQAEVDRYFTDPGQAAGYKIGQLKILALRESVSSALGAKFDIRAFHEAVLAGGALPLDMLEAEVKAHLAQAS